MSQPPPADKSALNSTEAQERQLFAKYVVRLTALARSRLSKSLRRRLDPEDLVMSAFRSFFIGVREGRWSQEGDLWSLLAMITIRKAAHQARRHRASQRSVDREETGPAELVPQVAPTSEDAAIFTEELEWLIDATTGLDREILLQLLRGETVETIARALEVSSRTVRRSLQRIRELVSADRSHSQLARSTELRPTLCEVLIGHETTRTLNDLVLHEMIGQGAIAKVFRATDRVSGTAVAVKFLRKSCWTDFRAVRTCLNELEVLTRLSHPSLGSAIGWGRTMSGAVFLVMEWIDGANLSAWTSERQTIEVIRRVALDVAAGLSVAHAAGIVHCDLKPENVMQDQAGRFRVIDFGLSQWPGADDDPHGGSVGYIAPEQISPAFGEISARTDVYGLGALLYALLTGAPPWGTDSSSLVGVLSEQPVTDLPATIPESLRHGIAKAIRKNPLDRWPDIQTMNSELQRP